VLYKNYGVYTLYRYTYSSQKVVGIQTQMRGERYVFFKPF
jgi:hypothetical protein